MTQPLPAPESGFAVFAKWLCEPLPADVARSLDRLCRAEDVQRVAVMPDVHLSGEVCVGTVLATARLIYPQAVGSDIGCGIAAIAFDASADVLHGERAAATILAGLYDAIPTNKHPREKCAASLTSTVGLRGTVRPEENPFAIEGDDTRELILSDSSLARLAARDGRLQCGTLGRGNHFVELQSDTDGRLWLMVHSGSRGMGQAITRFHRHRSRTDGMSGLSCLDAVTDAGQAYLNDVAWAMSYASASRLAMVAAVAHLIDRTFRITADPETLWDGNHNHVRQEYHAGRELWVHRKGALSAADGELGVIPGSMGTRSFHTCGRGEPSSLSSSSHGAGRTLSRKQAAQVIREKDFGRQMRGVWYDHRCAAAFREEAPAAYKDIGRVMHAQRALTRITRELRPLLCFKGT